MAGTSEYPALGFDPAPGVVSNVESVATDLQQVAQRMGSAHDALSKIGRSDGLWEGKAADAFRGTVDELPKHLDQAHRSMGHAAQALSRWSQDLGSMQQKARGQEAEAAEAQRRLKQAESDPNLGLANQHFPDQASLQQAQQKLDSAQAEVDGANRDLEAIREQAKRLQEQHDELATKVEEALRKAKDEAPEAPDLLERLGNFLEDVGKGISDAAGKAWQWVQDHADDINKVGDVLSTVGTVLGVVAIATSWIPGVNAVTSAAAVGVNAAALGAHALAKAGGADVSWGKMGMDAIGVVPAGKAVAGAKNAVSQAAKASATVNGTGRVAKTSELLTGTGKVTTESRAIKEATGVNGKVDITPTTVADLKANPSEAVHNAAMFTHAKSVKLTNTIFRTDLEPFSASGIAAGSGMASAKKVAMHEGLDHLSGEAESKVKKKIG